jgi:RND family efflux transporter MFP subunit
MQSNRTAVGKRANKGSTLVAVALATVLAVGGWSFRGVLWPAARAQYILDRARIADFVHDVVERGEVESSANVNVICEVQSQNAEGVRIIEIVPEGTLVKAGEFLVKLDDALLRTERDKQLIAVNTSDAALAKAMNDLAAFHVAKEEYERGTFKQEEAKLESELLLALENANRAAGSLTYSKKMWTRGFINRIKLESDEFAVERYAKERDVAQIKLDVLRNYTKVKTIKKHDTDIKTAEATVNAERAKHRVELDKLAQIERQLEKCLIKAPIDGQVVYAEIERWRSNGDDAIRPGTRVREQQVIIRLPDPQKMQVKARTSEARVDRVKAGMPVKIELDALPGVVLSGRVKKVNPYPSSDNWFNSNVKEYATFVEIENPPEALRPGMSAHVAIRVENVPNVLQVPVQAVVERGHKFYCLVHDSLGRLTAREVLIGSTNEKFLVIREGLTQGQEVAMNPRAHLEEVGLPAVDTDAPTAAPNGPPKEVAGAPSSAEAVGRGDEPAPEASGKSTAETAAAPAADSGPGG